jgi:hypothetical protein
MAYFGAYGKAVDGTFLISGADKQLVNNTGIFLYSNGTSVAVARPGDFHARRRAQDLGRVLHRRNAPQQ